MRSLLKTIVTVHRHRSLRSLRSGTAIVYVAILLTLFCVLLTVAVDFGHLVLVKTQLQAVADAAARAGAASLPDQNAATSQAVLVGTKNAVDGTPVAIDSTADVDFGVWVTAARKFTVLNYYSRPSATAVRVTVRRTAVRGSPITAWFGGLLGIKSTDITATAVAAIGQDYDLSVPSAGCPWLAGMPAGTTIANTDDPPHPSTAGTSYSPLNSPTPVTQYPITPGDTLRFRNVQGTSTDVTGNTYDAGGDTTRVNMKQAAGNGINSTTAPLNGLMGIFLNDSAPTSTSAYGSSMESALDFSSQSSRDFTTLNPQLRQVFYIGRGLTSTNVLQGFKVPNGATRLFLGAMDQHGHWTDNVGDLSVTTYDNTITLVK